MQEFSRLAASVKAGSITFHTRMGFTASEPIRDYDGPEDMRVAFKKMLGGSLTQRNNKADDARGEEVNVM